MISFDGTTLSEADDKLGQVDVALRAGDLRVHSSLALAPFEPYAIALRALKERGQLARSEIEGILRGSVTGTIGTHASERLLHYAVLLGQGWIDGRMVIDGSKRPTSDEALRGLYVAFKANARDRLVRVRPPNRVLS